MESLSLEITDELNPANPTIEVFQAMKEPFKVSSNEAALMPPFITLTPDAAFRAAMEHYDQMDLERHIQDTLARYNITWLSILQRRRVKGGTLNPVVLDSIIVQTRSQNIEVWKEAATALRDFLKNRSRFSEILEVEIYNGVALEFSPQSFPLRNDPVVIDALTSVRLRVLEELKSAGGRGLKWSSLSFHERMKRNLPNNDENRKPTILVYCIPGSRYDYESLERRLHEVITTVSITLNVEILPGRMIMGGRVSIPEPRPLVPTMLSEPRNGSSIGIKDAPNRAGSLGFWAQAAIPGRADGPVKLMCTAFHVVTTVDNDIQELTLAEGVKLKGQESLPRASVELPAHADGVGRAQYLEKELARKHYPEMQRELDEIQRRLQDPKIGQVLIASGFRKNDRGRRMDWAFVETPKTYRKNEIPNPLLFGKFTWIPTEYQMIRKSSVSSIGVLNPGDWVCKNGCSTKATAGEVNRMDRVVNWEEHTGFISSEMEVLGLGHDFAAPGDSGSAVFNAAGELVGLMVGVEPYANSQSSGIVTPIQDILEDVEKREGIKIVLS
ncbi:hypothetical protein MMC09_006805 [Bachmanniomyces sp. S44760]|nr:hypothetical protein [Bachmanniomyces sp. S44760]